MNKKEECCFSRVLKVIHILQKNASGSECFDESCTRPFLGGDPELICFNTRPVSFYVGDGSLFEASFQDIESGSTITRTSSVFRVEKVNECCVLLRILKPATNPTAISPFTATNELITINLNCICALRCLDDVVLENI